MIDLTDEDLARMRTDTESNFVERKTVRDKDGWLKTAVAFANSAPLGAPAVLFVGLNDNGTFEEVPPDHNWEKQQKTVTDELNRAYPPIFSVFKVSRGDGERQCLGVIIWGSPDRPHFTGKAYIRVGPQTREASDAQFNLLIAERNSKAYEIGKWVGKEISVAWYDHLRTLRPHPSNEAFGGSQPLELVIEGKSRDILAEFRRLQAGEPI